MASHSLTSLFDTLTSPQNRYGGMVPDVAGTLKHSVGYLGLLVLSRDQSFFFPLMTVQLAFYPPCSHA